MKFLIHGNAPTVKTGYGVQIANLALALKNAGHDVAISSTYGVQGSIQTWRGMRVYPCGYDVNSNDLIHGHADHWFGDTPRDECWIVTLIDVWAMNTPRLADYNVAAWTPIDHFPAPPAVLEFFSRTQAVPVAMSRFGERLLHDAGLDPVYIPLSVDTSVYKPDPDGAKQMRALMDVPDDAFLVGMVAMNKGWAKDRKGFNEAFWAFGQFIKTHPDAVLYVHAEKFGGAEGQHLEHLRINAGIPDTNFRWVEQYAYRVGYTAEMMAATYSAFDVLLAPSHGEGFCVPLIEAQACGVPVIATDFSAQSELIGSGWTIEAQPEWDPPHHAAFVTPLIDSVLEKLHCAYATTVEERAGAAENAIKFAGQYDTRTTFDRYWVPFIDSLKLDAPLEADREPMPDENAVAVICPVLNRPQNVAPLIESFEKTTEPGTAQLFFVYDDDDDAEIAALHLVVDDSPYIHAIPATHGSTFAEKVNAGYEQTDAPWLLLIGDDVRFHDGWLDAARKLSDRYDVIGTNDGGKNPKVTTGAHADHFFVRRAYVDEHGACLDGPGVLAPECYNHWYVDMEIVSLAKARGVFTPCFDSLVEHLHPGYDGREDLRQADPTYMRAVEYSAADRDTWMERLPLIQMQRTSRAKVA